MPDTKNYRDGYLSKDTHEFIGQIAAHLANGYGFVPFIGAGFSAPSGAPLIYEIEDYLQRCICISLGIDGKCLPTDTFAPWNPRTDQWPPFVDTKRLFDSGYWVEILLEKINEISDEINALCQKNPDARWKPDVRRKSAEMRLLSEGYGAMQDWRTALLFLSRLTRGRRGTGDADLPRLGVPQQEVIDACFRQVLKGKFPTLGHRMLAALAGAMRLDIILTTNFDNLLEQAFETARNPLEVFEVQLGGKLPDWSTLSSVRALVKLHGGRASLRADYSLDEPPSEEDKQTFLHYLLSAKGRNEYSGEPEDSKGKKGKLNSQNHLLVIGFSATDLRIRAFIEYAWEYLGRDFRVYWICHTKKDVEEITKFIIKSANIIYTKDKFDIIEDVDENTERAKYIVELQEETILRHTQVGLFLLQLYQSLRKTLPPLGSIFPSIARLTFPTLEPAWITEKLKPEPDETVDRVKKFTDAIKLTLDRFDTNKTDDKIILASSVTESSGITSACARSFRELEENGKVCLWIDMNDVSSAENLFEALLEAIYYRLGLEDWIPPTVGYSKGDPKDKKNQEDRRAEEIKRLICSNNKRWVVFLNGYETPGANGLDDQPSNDNGWLDKLDSKSMPPMKSFTDESNSAEDLFHLLRILCERESRMSVILIYRQRGNFSDFVRKHTKFNDKVQTKNIRGIRVDLEASDPSKRFFNEEEIIIKVLDWIKNDHSEIQPKGRFLHALVLMRRPRHLATLWSSALSLPPSESYREVKQIEWINDLEAIGLVRRKPGGLIWVYARCRRMILDILAEKGQTFDNLSKDKKEFICTWKPVSEEADIHKEIAEWYERVLDASEAPAAAFEATLHFCWAGLAFLRGTDCNYGRSRANIDAAATLLKSNSFLIQTHGYSRGSCRRLNDIAFVGTQIYGFIQKIPDESITKNNQEVNAVKQAVRNLWIVCAEVMRAVAREVGEDAKAYYRNRQVARLILGDKTWDDVCIDDLKLKISEELRLFFGSKKKTEDANVAASGTNVPAPELTAQTAAVAGPNAELLDPDWLRWRRWCGMLAIASRSYGKAQRVFEDVLGPFDKQHAYKTTEKQLRKTLIDQAQRLEFLRLMEQSVELMLLQNIVIRRLKRLPTALLNEDEEARALDESKALLRNANAMIDRGINLARKTRDSERSSDARDTIIANWCETRLLMHRSMVESQRKLLELNPTQVLDAMGILSDAEAKVRVADARRVRSELALIDLHRAEAKLCEAEVIELQEDQTSVAFVFRLPFLIEQLGKQERHFEQFNHPFNQQALTRAKALVEDSLRFLNRAEPVLRDRRRNVWWTTWFFERKLRAIVLSVTISVFDGGTPIPFLGLEAAMRLTETEADRLLADTVRMVRVDAYRLASVIEAYISCYNALKMRLDKNLEQDTRLPHRLEDMLANLRKASLALTVAFKYRTEKLHQYGNNGDLDPSVKEYIERVGKRASDFLSLPENVALLKQYDSSSKDC